NETAFRNCTALESFDLANVTSIGTKAFNGCSALTSISINNLPTMEKDDAFDEWHFANTEIAVPDEKYSTFTSDAYWGKFSNFKHPSLFAYTEVSGGYSVSKSPYALNEDFTGMLEIPAKYNSSNVVAVAEGAFQGFTGLTGVTLPEGLKTIGSNAFAGCTGIKTVNNMRTEAITGDGVCPENIFDASVYGAATLYVPFGYYDAFSNYAPWKKFTTIKQGFGERTLNAPAASTESGDFNWSFDLTLTNPNEVGSIYYYIVSEGEEGNVGYQTFPYQHPITIPAKTCTVWTYVSDGINCSEPNSFKYTYVRLATEVGLDKVLSANFGDRYFIDTNLYGHYHDGKYLYASTMGNSGSSKNTFNVDKKTEWWSDKEGDFNQEDWVAISGLPYEYVGRQIDSGSLATVGPNTDYPVISFSGSLNFAPATMGINTFRVANFNIHAESAAVNNIWLVAPQPAEYCTVTGYVDIDKNHVTDGYLVLQSAEGPTETTIKDENTGVETTILIEPLTMNVYYNNATMAVDHTGWYAFTGIVSKEGESLKFTALSVDEKPTGVEGVDAGTDRVFAAGGNINVAADTQTAITVYSANGQLVSALEASDATIAVAPGFYIVKVGNRVTKLAVK
ncbi:MAG: leucine-rich repeat protein, partial [Muribaculaceae bacterium]|nr:leucine-rich repeat protein [Muribaculaceae bacterium]